MFRWTLLIALTAACQPQTHDVPHECLGAMLTATLGEDVDGEALASFVEERLGSVDCYDFVAGRLECLDQVDPCGWSEADATEALPAFEEALVAFDPVLDGAAAVEQCACRVYF